jgi:hypothetical protein
MLTHIHPTRHEFACPTSSHIKVLVLPARCLDQSRNRQVPRVPLPAPGVTWYGKMSRILSEDVTPPSTLLRTHASDPRPPADFVDLVRSVFAGCGQPLLDVGPSRRYLRSLSEDAWTLTPLRSWRSVRLCVRPPRYGRAESQDIGLALESTGLARRENPAMQLRQGGYFGAAVIR